LPVLAWPPRVAALESAAAAGRTVISSSTRALLARGARPATFASASFALTTEGARGHVPPAERIAVLRHDCIALVGSSRNTPAGFLPSTVPPRLLQERRGTRQPIPVWFSCCRPPQRRGGAAIGTKGLMSSWGSPRRGALPPGLRSPGPASGSTPPAIPASQRPLQHSLTYVADLELLELLRVNGFAPTYSFRRCGGSAGDQPGVYGFHPEAGDRLRVRTTYVVRDGKPD